MGRVLNQTLAHDVAAPTGAATEALTITGLTKQFGGTAALDDVALHVRPGSVHALLGGNGSGKSTLIKILAGVYRADAGTVQVHGREVDVAAHNGPAAHAAGLRFVHQDLGLFDTLSVAENFALDSNYPTGRGGRIAWRTLRARVSRILADYELDFSADTTVGSLSASDRTMLAIARASSDDEGGIVLVLDEPTASLGSAESDRVLDLIRRRAALGQTILLVGHRLSEVLQVADDFTVLRDGKLIDTIVNRKTSEDELVTLMAGRFVAALESRAHTTDLGETRVRIEHLAAGPLTDVSLTIARGEIVGVAGLAGSGRSTLLSVLFGVHPAASGTVSIDGAPYSPTGIPAAMAAGVALVPEHRGRDAALAELSVRENLSVAVLHRYWRPSGMNRRAETDMADRLIEAFRVKVDGADALFSSMSGGNQQKVILARWLQRDPRLLLLDEPTQGVDIMSRTEIYDTVRAESARGMSVLVASSDVAELCALCDRILVLHDGRVASEADGETLHPDDLNALLLRLS